LGLKIKGRRNLRELRKSGSGAVTISNHVHNLDAAMTAIANFPKKPIYTAQSSNFKLPIAGIFVNILGAVPIPTTMAESKVFFLELSKKLASGRFVHVYPEGELVPYDINLREFKKGAFQLAVEGKVPVVPMIITYRPRKDKNKKSKMTVTILKPIYPDHNLLKADAIKKLADESYAAMTAAQKEINEKILVGI
jgi:1-acyl-sn-glycerol-3-phosphate acyltransferase